MNSKTEPSGVGQRKAEVQVGNYQISRIQQLRESRAAFSDASLHLSPLATTVATTTSLSTVNSFVQVRAEQFLSRSTLEGFSEHEKLDLIIDGKHASTSDTTKDVSTSALEHGFDTLVRNDLAGGIQG